MDPLLAKAIAKRDRLRKELDEAENAIKFMRSLEDGKQPEVNSIPVLAERKPSQAQAVMQTAIEMLSTNDYITIMDLKAEVDRRGIHIGGDKPIANLSAIVSRNAKGALEYVQGKGWKRAPRASH